MPGAGTGSGEADVIRRPDAVKLEGTADRSAPQGIRHETPGDRGDVSDANLHGFIGLSPGYEKIMVKN